jgi:small subunit ribosomal protein S2
MVAIVMKDLLEAGVHFGHQTRRWNPKMSKYIFCERNKIHILNLQKTVQELKKAHKFVSGVASEGKPILFVGTKKQACDVIETEAKRCGTFFVSSRWLGGILTNFLTIRQSVNRLKELDKMKEEGILKLLSKKEASRREKERIKLEQSLKGLKEMDSLPGVVFIVDTVREAVAVAEANKMKIPVVGVCDTDADIDLIDHIIPANDDAVRSVKLITTVMADAVAEGKSVYESQQPAETTSAGLEVSEDELSKEIKFDANTDSVETPEGKGKGNDRK